MKLKARNELTDLAIKFLTGITLVILVNGWALIMFTIYVLLNANNIHLTQPFFYLLALTPTFTFLIANILYTIGYIHINFVEDPKPRRKRTEKFKQAHLDIREPIEITKLT